MVSSFGLGKSRPIFQCLVLRKPTFSIQNLHFTDLFDPLADCMHDRSIPLKLALESATKFQRGRSNFSCFWVGWGKSRNWQLSRRKPRNWRSPVFQRTYLFINFKNANIPKNTHERVVWTDIATTSIKWTFKQVFALSLQIRTRETIKWDTKDRDVIENNDVMYSYAGDLPSGLRVAC